MAKVIARFEKVTFEQFVNDFNKQIENGELSELVGKTDLAGKADLNEMYESIVLPHRKTKGSAGHDFVAPFDIVLQPGQTIVIPTGIRCFIKPDYVLDLFPRSGQGFTYRLRLNNTVGKVA
jgi:dUTP pyrophosphatase